MSSTTLLAVLGIVVPCIGVIFGWILKTMLAITKRLTCIEEQMRVVWKILDPALEAILHSPTHHERDRLVKQFFVDDDYRDSEAERLAELLEEAISDERTNRKRVAAEALRFRLDMKMQESRAPERHGRWGHVFHKC